MTFSARFWRSILPACVVLTAVTLGLGPSARAQFFFPFFDNRPTVRPKLELRPRRQHADVELRPRRQSADIDLRPRRQRGEAENRPRQSHEERTARHHRKRPGHATEKADAAVAPAKPAEATAPVAEGPPPPYEPQLLRLSELMGALAWLQSVCDASAPGVPAQVKASSKASSTAVDEAGDAPWRERMEGLMSAEAAGPTRREKLAGAYNYGLQGYQFSYRVCTPSALLARRRFLEEGALLAHEISTQYRAN